MTLPHRESDDWIAGQSRLARRRWLRAAIGAIGATIAGIVGTVSAGAIIAPAVRRRPARWVPAGRLDDLVEGVPTPVALRVTARDGYYETVERPVVFLIRAADGVRALSSTCTHLGCRVSYDAASDTIRCPCHGGAYDATGRVVAGPPPRPLDSVVVRVEQGRIAVQV